MDAMSEIPVREGALDKHDLKNRLRNAQGYMRAIVEMIYGEADCMDILRQVSAMRGALRANHQELWQAYLLDEECRLRSENEARCLKAWQDLEALIFSTPAE
jgi:DNA-binding FrmR family transcriptional regulator